MNQTDPYSWNGAGLALRPVHVPELLSTRPPIAWLEVLADNYLYGDCRAERDVLRELRGDYPMALHSVGLDVGSHTPLDADLLHGLTRIADQLQPELISTHLCWLSSSQVAHHDLLPLPFTEEAVQHCANRIQRMQDALGERIAIENVSTYLRWSDAEMSEAEFLSAVALAADCYLLIDLNNIYVNYTNHREGPADLDALFATIPAGRIRQYHLAGFDDRETHLLDTHGAPVAEAVWDLFARAVREWGPLPVCIERDNDIPPELAPLLAEVDRAQELLLQCA